MLVNRLPFIIILGVRLPVRAGNRLRRFVCLEAKISRLVGLGPVVVPQPVVAKHQIVMRLQILWIDAQGRLEFLHGIGVTLLQKKHAPYFIVHHAVARELRNHGLQMGDSPGIVAVFLQRSRIKEIRPPQSRINRQRFLQHLSRAGGIAVLVQEGDTAGARKVLEKALAIDPRLGRTNFFYARALKEDGDYAGAIAHLQTVIAQFPRDRVVHNEVGRVLFLQKRYADAVKEFETTLSIDPEDLQAHYNLMLCYNGLGNDDRAEAHKARYLRFKADESAQAITGPYRQAHAEDNNERQPIHEHVSVALGLAQQKKPATTKTAAKLAMQAGVKRGGGK